MRDSIIIRPNQRILFKLPTQQLCSLQLEAEDQKALLARPIAGRVLSDPLYKRQASQLQFLGQVSLSARIDGVIDLLTERVECGQERAALRPMQAMKSQQFSTGLPDAERER